MNYPDIGSGAAKLMGKRWVFLLSVHLYYFDPKTIRKMLLKHGFSTVRIKPYFQTLSLGYLAFRMHPYSKSLSKLGTKTVRALRMENLQIPYWLGQTMVIARKEGPAGSTKR